ncbi:S-layer homology domain-containing protein, partial [Bacillaceae bacterium SIJ1]|uniref:S-layer homology domain-containing protein n=1 Tax=Litoribacterium kuwaitense TaxID=1398745 RepID=UPI0013EAFD46
AKDLGIVQGTGDNRFNPNAHIARQDLFTMTARALTALDKLPANAAKNTLEGYEDVSSIASYAKDGISQLEKTGLVQGNENQLKPLDEATRAETAVMIDRILQFYVK